MANAEPASVLDFSVAPGGGPTVLRILLGAQLRRLREARNISRERAGYEIRASDSKISRMELGRVSFKERDISDLLTLYGVSSAAEREKALSLARRASANGWWHNYSDLLPKWFEDYIGLEEAATRIRAYEVQFVPGLLQNEGYARAVTMLGHAATSSDAIDRRVEMRMKRQELLDSSHAPHLWAVVDEAVVRRPIGSRAIMRAQLEQLIEACARPNVTLQIVPFSRGGHAAAGGPFSILRFAEQDLPDVVYLEQLTSALYLDKRDDIERYLAVMEQLCVEADPAADTPEILKRILSEF